MRNALKLVAVAAAAVVVAGTATAQSTADDIAKYREMIADGNPAELFEMQGEELWRTPRGPRKATLEKCDLGMGPGVVKGASARMPRFFKDTGMVQDLESRLLTCMETLQGIDPKLVIDGKFNSGERKTMDALVAYVVTHSKGDAIKVDMSNPKMKELYALGERAFYYRAGPMDFSCATCHGEDDKRIRLQDLPNLTTHKGAAAGWGSWPAYRVSNSQFWTMQHRLNDCFRQQRTAEPIYASEVTIALSVYMAAKANGGEVMTPGLKR